MGVLDVLKDSIDQAIETATKMAGDRSNGWSSGKTTTQSSKSGA
jgi:hypothetical protein